MQSLHEVNKKAMELKQNDARVSGQRHRMTLGLYFFNEQIEPQIPAVTDANTSGDEMIVKKATTDKSA